MSQTDTPWTIAYADESMVAAHDRSLLVLSWRGGAKARHVSRARALMRALVTGGQAPLTVVNVFSLGARGGPSDELRQATQGLYEDMLSHYFAEAHVVLGEGFWAAGVRAFLGSLSGVTARRLPTDTFGSLEDAMAWVGQLEGQRPSLRSGARARARQIHATVLAAHGGHRDAPMSRTEAPTRPQYVEEPDAPLVSSRGLVGARCGPVYVSYWTAAAMTRDVGRMHDDVEAMARSLSAPVPLLLVVAPGASMLNGATRTRATAMIRQLHGVLDRAAVVTSGSGLWGVALGGVFREAALVLNTKIEWQTFEQLTPAVGWLSQTSVPWRRRIPERRAIEGVLGTLSASAR